MYDPQPRDPFVDPVHNSDESHEMEQLNYSNNTEDSSERPHIYSSKHNRKAKGSWITWWYLELLSSLLSLACMLAIVGILFTYQNRLVTSWPYSSFSLNSVIALLATVTRSSLMVSVAASIGQRKWRWFLPKKYGGKSVAAASPERPFRDFEVFDDSSRGLLGSIMLLAKIGFRDIALIGAVITILSLLFNTFTQNLAVTDLRRKDGSPFGDRAGAIARSTNYNNFAPGFNHADQSPDLSTLSALYAGMLSSNVTDIPVSCPTGNCTWPIVPSLGVCGACIDVTSSLQESCPNSTTCQYSVPGGGSLVNPSVPQPNDVLRPAVLKVDTGPDVTGPGTIWNASRIAKNGSTTEIRNFNIIGQSKSVYEATTPLGTKTKLTGVKAYECALWFCLQAHRTNQSFGITDQGVSAHWNQAVQPADSDGFGFYGAANFTNIPEQFNVEPGVVYGVSVRAMQAAWSAIDALLFGTVNAMETNEVSFIGEGGGSLDGLKGLWYAMDDLDSWMARLTQSLSKNVRLTGTAEELNDTKYDGVAWTEEAYIKVQWPWIIYPWALVIMSLAFLLVTIIENRGLKPWKNTSSAMLFTRLDDQLQDDALKAHEDGRGLTEDFDKKQVRLNTGDWTFRLSSNSKAWHV